MACFASFQILVIFGVLGVFFRYFLQGSLLRCELKDVSEQSHWNTTLNITYRAVFKCLSKVITWLRLLRVVIGLKDSVFQPMRSKTKTNRTMYAWFFPRFERVTGNLLGIVIGSRRCLFLLWLVGVIALVLVFLQSFENRSIYET